MYIFSWTLNFIFNLCIPFLSQIFNLSNQISNFLQTLGKWLLFLILLMELSYIFWLSLLSIGLVPCLKLLFKKKFIPTLTHIIAYKRNNAPSTWTCTSYTGRQRIDGFPRKKRKAEIYFHNAIQFRCTILSHINTVCYEALSNTFKNMHVIVSSLCDAAIYWKMWLLLISRYTSNVKISKSVQPYIMHKGISGGMFSMAWHMHTKLTHITWDKDNHCYHANTFLLFSFSVISENT